MFGIKFIYLLDLIGKSAGICISMVLPRVKVRFFFFFDIVQLLVFVICCFVICSCNWFSYLGLWHIIFGKF